MYAQYWTFKEFNKPFFNVYGNWWRKLLLKNKKQWGAFYLLIANFLATLNIGGVKELAVLL